MFCGSELGVRCGESWNLQFGVRHRVASFRFCALYGIVGLEFRVLGFALWRRVWCSVSGQEFN